MSPPSHRRISARNWRFACTCTLLTALLLAAPGCRPGSSSRSRSRATTAALTVDDTSPRGGAAAVPPSAAVEVTFSTAIDFGTVTGASFAVAGSQSGPATGAFVHDASRRKVRFTASAGFLAGEQVTVRLSQGIQTPSGQPLRGAEWGFSIAAAGPAPSPPAVPSGLRVTGASPPAFAAAVVPGTQFTFAFSEPVGSGGLEDGVTVWARSTGRVPARAELSADGLWLAVRPLQPLPAPDQIVVRLAATIRAAGGAAFAGYSLEVRTQALPPPQERRDDRVLSTLGDVKLLDAADFDLDGRLDLVYASENETFVDVLVGGGDGTFDLGTRIDLGVHVLALAPGDLDADGDPDLVTGATDRASVFTNLAAAGGAGGVRFEDGPTAPVGAAVRAVALCDLDHLGGLDAVLDTDRGLQAFLGAPGATPAQVIGTGRQARTNLAAGDLDLDGHADLLYGSRRATQVTYHLRTPPGPQLLGDAQAVSLGAEAEQVAVAGLSGGMYPEILTLTLGSGGAGAELKVSTRSGSTYTTAGLPIPMASEPGSEPAGDSLETGRFTVADLDGNGFLDVLFAAAARGEVYWFANHAGVLDAASGPRLVLRAPGMLLPLAADLNADGSLDILAAGAQEIHNLLPATPRLEIGAEDRFTLGCDDAQWRQGDKNAALLVRGSSTRALDGFSAAIGYDPAAFSPLMASTDGTLTGATGVEFSDLERYFAEGVVTYKVLVEFGLPFEGRTIPPGENELLFRVHFDVAENAPLGDTPITFLESAGPQSVPTVFLVAGETVRPQATNGKVSVLPPKDPPPGGNRMKLENARATPGEQGVVPVLGQSARKASGFTSIVAFDPEVIEVLELDIAGTPVANLEPDLMVPEIRNQDGIAILTVIFELLPPFERIGLPPDVEQTLFNVRFQVQPDALPGVYPLRFANEAGSPPKNNIFVFEEGVSEFPDLILGSVTIEEEGPRFLRGDVDAGGRVDLGDSVYLTDHLFRGGSQPPCRDAADTDDNGKLELTDAIYLLNHLFQGGPGPAAPYPEAGIDPSDDQLDCATGL